MAKQTQIGERRWRIKIEEPTTSRGTSGQEIIAWDSVCNIWAKVSYKQAGSREEIMGDQPVTQTAVVFDIAYRDGLNEKMRVVFNSEYFNILYIQNPDFKTSLLIYAQKQE